MSRRKWDNMDASILEESLGWMFLFGIACVIMAGIWEFWFVDHGQ